MARSIAVIAALAIIMLSAGSAQAHEDPNCSFPANITDRANLTVAGAALSALGGADLFPTHGTVFLPNDAAFTALVTALNVTPSELFGDTLVNTTVAILAYHYLPDSMYTEAQLVGNGTLDTELGELASEASGRNVSYELTFRRANGELQIMAENSTANVVDDLGDVCNRQVYVIDAVLIPADDLLDVPQTIPAALAARTAAAEAEEEEEGDEAPSPSETADTDGDETESSAPAPAPQAAHPAAAAGALLGMGALGASLLLHAL